MKTKIFVIFAIILFAHAANVKEQEDTKEPEQNKDKRQTQEEALPGHLVYRTARKQEQVAPVEEPQDDDRGLSRSATEEYRPGQVFSLNAQELLELQPERKAPLTSGQQLQQLYSEPQPQHKENLQQFYYVEPQTARQVSLHPSHAVIARPHYSAIGGEASVGAALSVSDSSSNPSSFDRELLALLGQPVGQDQPSYAQQQIQQVSTQSVAPQYQQVDRYITKPSKKPTKLRSKVQITPPQASTAPQQYLIETTNVQQQQPQQQQLQYRPVPQPQAQRTVQALRYTPIQPTPAAAQQVYYQNPEPQGLKIVPAPKLQQPRAQINYRFVPQYQQAEATPKQYRIVEAPRLQAARQEPQRISASSIERPVTYLKRFPEPEKLRAVKYYEQPASEEVRASPQPAQVIGEQYYLRPLYRGTEQRPRYDLQSLGLEQARVESTKPPPHSAIYVSKNLAPKKPLRQQQALRVDQPIKLETQQYRQEVQQYRPEQLSRAEQVNIEQHGQSLDDQRAHLPPPRNNKAYTPEEFQALVAAGYAVTPIPVGSLGQQAQSRSSVEPAPAPAPAGRRPLYSRRHQYLPLRSDEAP
ncbi:transcription factor SPT20 homolog [Cydia strobilella]|uniref:transcription factor SPT20 homolog n=1 Tax=Cydia strobilella TaxID=1100964 RepID=UPI003005EFEA